jgi:hypothetical protein
MTRVLSPKAALFVRAQEMGQESCLHHGQDWPVLSKPMTSFVTPVMGLCGFVRAALQG